MTILTHELKRGYKGLMIWSGAVGFMVVICLLMYPEMKGQMVDFNEMMAGLGKFTAAFGMDQLNFGTAMGFYGVECGNILGIGGAFYAAILGIGILAKEESNHTAEFLLTHPINRNRVLLEKLVAIKLELFAFNLFAIICAIVSFFIIKEDVVWKEFWLFHFAQFVMQAEIMAICFGISAFIRNNAIGMGLGFAGLLYFMNIFINIDDNVKFLGYITPFQYADAANIIGEKNVEWGFMIVGIAIAFAFILLGFAKYNKKDIAA
ncbi:MAG: ABC transporter permease subunit [Anaerovoracaceae bacterium]